MVALPLIPILPLPLPPRSPLKTCNRIQRRNGFRVLCSPSRSQAVESAKPSYKPGIVDDLFLRFFRAKLAEEVGWDSEKPGYDGLIEVVNRLMMKGRSNLETEQAAVRVLNALFPPFILVLFKMLIAPIGGGKVASMMVARATALSCQWLMGSCSVNSIELPEGSSCTSGVFVEKCKYLEESKCVGICINTCKLPTQTFFKDSMGVPLHMEPNFSDYSCQTFFKDSMGVPLHMEPNFSDYSCQFKFGVLPPESDKIFEQPCLEMCPNATRRKEIRKKGVDVLSCPKG